LKILRLHKELAADQLVEIVSTFLGAHVVPAEFRGKAGGAERYIQLMEQNMLPEIGESRLAEFCDVFLRSWRVFGGTVEARAAGGPSMGTWFRGWHAEQLSRTGAHGWRFC